LRRIRWTLEAQVDLRAIASFYGQIAPNLADRLIDDVQRASLVLLDHPQIGATVAESTLRRWRAGGTPFLLFYRVSDTSVRILKVRDVRSDWRPV